MGSQAHEIIAYRPLLQEIAYRMLGSIEDAEDVVQETFLKWLQTEQEKVKNTKAYLVRSVTNNCITHLNQLKRTKDELFSNINTDKIIEKYRETDFFNFDLDEDLNQALLVINQKLAPLEKSIFVLREIFELEYEHLSEIFGQKKENLRQLLSRAKTRLQSEQVKFKISLPAQINFTESFKKAVSLGQLSQLVQEMSKETGLKK